MLALGLAAAVRASIILLVAALLSMRSQSPRTRYAIWAATLVTCLLIAVLPFFLPRVTIEIPGLTSLPRLEPQWTIGADTILPEQGAPDVPFAISENRTGVYVATVMLLVWLLGALVTAAWFIKGQLDVRRIAKSAKPMHDRSWSESIACIALQLRVPQPDILVADLDTIPFVAGTFSPVVILPRRALGWNDLRRRIILLHEMLHVRRRDALIDRIADCSCVLYWFHPGMWYAVRELRNARELACDDDVVLNGIPRSTYAHELLSLAGELKVAHASAALYFLHGASLTLRIDALLTGTRSPMATRTRSAVVTVIAIGMLCCLVGFGRAALAEADQIAAIAQYITHEKRSPDDYVRERAVWAVSRVRDGTIVEPLIAELSHHDWRARSYAAWSLALTQDRRATPALIKALEDPHWRVRGHAAFALDEIGDPRARPAMLRALSDPAWQVRIDAVEFLSKHRDHTTPALLQRVARHDPHPAVRKEAQEELAQR
jgi:beta-lactamase regulating signal transducer with metallopeptidase domain